MKKRGQRVIGRVSFCWEMPPQGVEFTRFFPLVSGYCTGRRTGFVAVAFLNIKNSGDAITAFSIVRLWLLVVAKNSQTSTFRVNVLVGLVGWPVGGRPLGR